MKTITVFNNKGGVGKTTLIYHFAHMLGEKGYKVLVADLDPQANLSSIFLQETRFLEIYSKEEDRPTVVQCLDEEIVFQYESNPLHIEPVYNSDNIGIVLGDLELSSYEDRLSNEWEKSTSGDTTAMGFTSALSRAVQKAGEAWEADFILVDVGPSLGAINRAALLGSDFVIVPVAPDLFSLQGLKNIGVKLAEWRKGWEKGLERVPPKRRIRYPSSKFTPLGYVILQHNVYGSRPVNAYVQWAVKIPELFAQQVIKDTTWTEQRTVKDDPYCLALLKNYYSLAPMAMQAKKPMFLLKYADGARGAHLNAVQRVYEDFEQFTETVLQKIEK